MKLVIVFAPRLGMAFAVGMLVSSVISRAASLFELALVK